MEKLPVIEKQHHFQFSEAPRDIFHGFKTAFSFPQHSKTTSGQLIHKLSVTTDSFSGNW